MQSYIQAIIMMLYKYVFIMFYINMLYNNIIISSYYI
jgi:hypothetical protein